MLWNENIRKLVSTLKETLKSNKLDAVDAVLATVITTDVKTCSRIIQGLLAAPKQIVAKIYEN